LRGWVVPGDSLRESNEVFHARKEEVRGEGRGRRMRRKTKSEERSLSSRESFFREKTREPSF
jgi:hypothetical protein